MFSLNMVYGDPPDEGGHLHPPIVYNPDCNPCPFAA